MKNRNGNTGLAGLSLVIITFIVAAFLLVLGIQLLAGFQPITDDYQNTVTHEDGAYINSTGYTLGRVGDMGFNNPTITSVVYTANNSAVASTKYSLVGNVLYNATANTYTDLNVTYDYQYGQSAYLASNQSIRGNASFADYWQIIILAVILGVVISMIVVYFSRSVRVR